MIKKRYFASVAAFLLAGILGQAYAREGLHPNRETEVRASSKTSRRVDLAPMTRQQLQGDPQPQIAVEKKAGKAKHLRGEPATNMTPKNRKRWLEARLANLPVQIEHTHRNQ
jgi:hypothetical protein